MRHLKTYRLFEAYEFDKSDLDGLIKSARKWKEDDFVEEYVYQNNITMMKILNRINKGDTVELARNVYKDGKQQYKDGLTEKVPYKTVVASDDYSDMWKFIMDNTEELQDEAREAFKANKNTSKPNFDKIPGETVKAYHASSKRFKKFEEQDTSQSGQIGADTGYFFFTERKNAEYYASTMEPGYIYDVELKIGNQLELNGEDVGTNIGRQSELIQAPNEGYDSVIIKDADTGYGITDEIIMFDDDNIKILKVTKA
jgi:hypothetical protein